MAGVVKSQQPPIDILRAYIQENRHKFVDLKSNSLRANHDHATCAGYINGQFNGRIEYLFTENKLQEIMGSRGTADELKRALHSKGLIKITSAGEKEHRYSALPPRIPCR
jgi:hypothetical protein